MQRSNILFRWGRSLLPHLLRSLTECVLAIPARFVGIIWAKQSPYLGGSIVDAIMVALFSLICVTVPDWHRSCLTRTTSKHLPSQKSFATSFVYGSPVWCASVLKGRSTLNWHPVRSRFCVVRWRFSMRQSHHLFSWMMRTSLKQPA